MVGYISYDTTFFIQAEGHIALACPADLKTNSTALRSVLRECDREQVFSLRPQVGKILTITLSITNKPSQTIHLITRANQRALLVASVFRLCLEKLISWLRNRGVSSVHFLILNEKRTVYSLANLHQMMMDLFAGTNVCVALHNRVYVSILGIQLGTKTRSIISNVNTAAGMNSAVNHGLISTLFSLEAP